MSMFNLDSTLDSVGGFWLPTTPETILPGNISTENGRMYFSESPTAKKLTGPELVKAGASSIISELSQIDALCALTKDHKCTFFHLTREDDGGLVDFESYIQVTTLRWRISAAVVGLHLPSSSADLLDGAAFYFTKINQWLPRAGRLARTDEGLSYISPSKALRVFDLECNPLGARVICEVFSRKMKSVPRIRIIPNKPQSLDWFVSLGPRLENFFALLLGTSVSLKRVQLFQGDKNEGWLVQKRRTRSQKVVPSIWIPCQSNELALALAHWLDVPEDKQPVEKTVLGMVRQSSLFVETEFLALAQALEGFGRLRFEQGLIDPDEFKVGLSKVKEQLQAMWGDSEITKRCIDSLNGANESSYRHRLGLIYDMLPLEFAMQLLGDRSEFLTKVVQTRNYFTHLGIKKGASVADDGKALFLLNQKLHALLRCVMLLDLGIPENLLRAPILYQSTRWK